MILRVLLILFSLSLISCGNSENNIAGKKQIKGPKNGLVHTYNEDGSISASINYQNDIRHGMAIDYYTDGKLRAEIDYVHGVKEGLAKWYHKNGQVYRTTEYIADQRQGWQKKYYEDGSIMSEIEFFEDHPAIGLKEYNKYGQERKAKTEFVLGEKTKKNDGTWLIQVKLNNKVKEVEFFQGELKKNKFLHEGLKAINKTSNLGYITLPKGKQSVTIVAKYKTRYKNYRVITGTAKL